MSKCKHLQRPKVIDTDGVLQMQIDLGRSSTVNNHIGLICKHVSVSGAQPKIF